MLTKLTTNDCKNIEQVDLSKVLAGVDVSQCKSCDGVCGTSLHDASVVALFFHEQAA